MSWDLIFVLIVSAIAIINVIVVALVSHKRIYRRGGGQDHRPPINL
jgi:hypothetical protein